MPILPERVRRLTRLFSEQIAVDPMEARIELLERRVALIEAALRAPTPAPKKVVRRKKS